MTRRNALLPKKTIYEEDLLALYANGERDFTSYKLLLVDLENHQLSGSNFSGLLLDQIHLVGADLREAKFRDTQLYQMSFHKTKLNGADFTQAFMSECFFNGADVSKACFRGATLTEVIFIDANLAGCDFEGAVFTDCYMPDGSIRTDGV